MPVFVWLEAEEREALKKLAKEQGKTVTEMVREIVTKGKVKRKHED